MPFNSLSGTLPSEVAQLSLLQDLEVEDNSFSLPLPRALVDLCQDSTACNGLPPESCSAFVDAELSWVNFETCTDCSGGPLGASVGAIKCGYNGALAGRSQAEQ